MATLTPISAPAAWRPMKPADLAAVVHVAALVHPAFPERPDIFAERLALFPEGCHVWEHEGSVAGYIISHPWFAQSPVALDSLLRQLPPMEETRYLHDLALLPEARGAGAGAAAAAQVIREALAAGSPSVSLVAVSGSAPFWARQGFAPAGTPALASKLAGYGTDARWMTRDLRA